MRSRNNVLSYLGGPETVHYKAVDVRLPSGVTTRVWMHPETFKGYQELAEALFGWLR